MKKFLAAAAIASTIGLGATTGMVAPASSQVLLQFGDQDSRAENRAADRADQIEARGDRRAERAADNGNYAKAAKIQRQSDRRANQVERRADDGNNGVIFQVQ